MDVVIVSKTERPVGDNLRVSLKKKLIDNYGKTQKPRDTAIIKYDILFLQCSIDCFYNVELFVFVYSFEFISLFYDYRLLLAN